MYEMEVQISPHEGAVFREKIMPGHARRHSAVSCAKMAEPIEMPFGSRTRVGQGSTFYMGAQPNRLCEAAMRPYVKLLLPHVIVLTTLIFKLTEHTEGMPTSFKP